MRDTSLRGPRRAVELVEDAGVPVRTPPADRGSESEGAGAGAEHRAQVPLMTSLPSFTADGGAPAANGSGRAGPPPAVATVEWWCPPSEADSCAEPLDHGADQVAGCAPPHTPSQRGGQRGARGERSLPPHDPDVDADAWKRWLDAWITSGEEASVGDEWDEVIAELVPVHWRPYEQRAISPSPPAPEGGDQDADQAGQDAAERRARAEVRGWAAIAGHQRRNRGWQGRHRGSIEVGRGLKVKEATKEERRLGERISHCGEHLIFRAPNCECDPHARPLLVGADLCSHRLCHHCARLRSRKLGRRVLDMVDQLRGKRIKRYALLTLTYRDTEVLEGSVSRCWADFRKLRQRKLWEPVLGCVATMEIKRGKRSRLWHPHLHVLVARASCNCLQGRRLGDGGATCPHGKIWCPHALNQCCVSEAWREITGDSYVVDVRAVYADEYGGMAGAVCEVVKYCTKLTEVSARERDDGESDVLELHRAIRCRRLLTTVGVFRGLREPDQSEGLLDDPESLPCRFCGGQWATVTGVWDERLRTYALRAKPGPDQRRSYADKARTDTTTGWWLWAS